MMVLAAAVANLAMWATATAAVLDKAGRAAVLTALITGVFGLVNTALQTIILRQARRNAAIARETRQQVGVVHETAREGVEELVDVKRKVGGERRRGERRHDDDRRRRHDD